MLKAITSWFFFLFRLSVFLLLSLQGFAHPSHPAHKTNHFLHVGQIHIPAENTAKTDIGTTHADLYSFSAFKNFVNFHFATTEEEVFEKDTRDDEVNSASEAGCHAGFFVPVSVVTRYLEFLDKQKKIPLYLLFHCWRSALV